MPPPRLDLSSEAVAAVVDAAIWPGGGGTADGVATAVKDVSGRGGGRVFIASREGATPEKVVIKVPGEFANAPLFQARMTAAVGRVGSCRRCAAAGAAMGGAVDHLLSGRRSGRATPPRCATAMPRPAARAAAAAAAVTSSRPSGSTEPPEGANGGDGVLSAARRGAECAGACVLS